MNTHTANQACPSVWSSLTIKWPISTYMPLTRTLTGECIDWSGLITWVEANNTGTWCTDAAGAEPEAGSMLFMVTNVRLTSGIAPLRGSSDSAPRSLRLQLNLCKLWTPGFGQFDLFSVFMNCAHVE